MAHPHLVGDGRFAERASKRFVVEQRIVSKAAGPSRCIENAALYGTAKCTDQSPVFHQCDDADESSGSVAMLAYVLQQQGVVCRVGGVRSGIASGVNAGSPAKCIHLKPRIIGEQKSIGKAAVVFGLADGVLLKRGAIF